MKKVVFAILAAFMFIVTGCFFNDDDGYSLSDSWVGFGIFQKMESNSNGYRIVMDNGDILTPVTDNFNVFYFVNDGDRVLVNYTILDDNSNTGDEFTEYFVRLNSIKKILMKGILDITEENSDSIGNDPIIVRDVWLTDSLLNFEINYLGNNKIHFINLVKEPGELSAATTQPIELELRHNNNDDQEIYSYMSFVSFNLSAIEITGLDSVEFSVSGYKYDGQTFNYDFVYNYGENSD